MDLLRHPDLLRRSDLDLSEHSLCGVPFAAPASAFPRGRVVEVTLSPIVRSILFDQENDKPKLYMDRAGDPIPFERVVDSVLEQEGVLHLAEQVSFGIERGIIARSTLYGRSLSPFHGTSDLKALLVAFGRPDKLVRTEANGDILFFDAYYEGSKKWLRWDDRWQRLAFIALGGTRDDVTTGTSGSVVRRDALREGTTEC